MNIPLWTKTLKLPAKTFLQVRSMYYEQCFPIEVRHFLAQWMEEKLWNENPDDRVAAELVNAFIQEIEHKAATMISEDIFLNKIKLLEAAESFKMKYSQNPHFLLNTIRSCLDCELHLVHLFENGTDRKINGPLLQPNTVSRFGQQFDDLRRKSDETLIGLRQIEQKQQEFALLYDQYKHHLNDYAQLQNQDHNSQNDMIRQQMEETREEIGRKIKTLDELMKIIVSLRTSVLRTLNETISQLHELENQVLDEVLRWKREQELIGIGTHFSNSLSNIQEWCENLAEITWFNWQHIKEAQRLTHELRLEMNGMVDMLSSLSNLNNQVTKLFSDLVTRTFIIELQPPQVLSVKKKFKATVRLLVGRKLNLHISPQVTAAIINKNEANIILEKNNTENHKSCGVIVNNRAVIKYENATRHLSASFSNMQVSLIKRSDKNGTEIVTEEKFSFLFKMDFTMGEGEFTFHLWALSVPVVVIVHKNQEPSAWATIVWDNASAQEGRKPFAVPDKVSWSRMAEVLSAKFQAVTGRSLTEDHLKFLAEKAFSVRKTFPLPNDTDYSSMELSWSEFCKEKLPNKAFTFWEWFYGIMKLVKDHLPELWTNDLITGFITKQRTEKILTSSIDGNFLLRFSESELGLTIAWVETNAHGVKEVYMLEPFTAKDLIKRSLADRISDLDQLLFLYPNVTKKTAFGKHYTGNLQPPSTNGYVKTSLKTHVVGLDRLPTHSTGLPQWPDTVMDIPSVSNSVHGTIDQLHENTTVSPNSLDLNFNRRFDGLLEDNSDFINYNFPEFIRRT